MSYKALYNLKWSYSLTVYHLIQPYSLSLCLFYNSKAKIEDLEAVAALKARPRAPPPALAKMRGSAKTGKAAGVGVKRELGTMVPDASKSKRPKIQLTAKNWSKPKPPPAV